MAGRQGEEALDTSLDCPPDEVERLLELGLEYESTYQDTGDMTNLETAIQYYQSALDSMPDTHPERSDHVHNLGFAYESRYQRTSAISDLDTALRQWQDAIDTMPDDHPDRADRLHNLGLGYRDKYEETGDMADLEAFVQACREGLDLITSDDHLGWAERAQDLAMGYRDKYTRTKAAEDLDRAIQSCHEVLEHALSPITHRLICGQAALALHAAISDWSAAYKVAFTAVSLVPILTGYELENRDKQTLVNVIVGLSSDAAAMSSIVGKSSYEAIRLLEQGRGIIIGSLSELRTDASSLEQLHPPLAAEFNELRKQLDAPTVTLADSRLRGNLGRKFQDVLSHIRTLPTFDRFLLEPTEEEMKTAAASGPIAIINVSDYRCDALIIQKSQLQTIHLPRLHSSDIRTRAKDLGSNELLDKEALEWLWETIAKPVLDLLGFTQTPTNTWPRVWWIPTGPLAKFPLHAAGWHSGGSSEAVLDRVISSYSSSLKLLMHSRERQPERQTRAEEQRAVLVSMQHTPNQSQLQFAPREVDIVNRLCDSMGFQVSKPSPCRMDVLFALDDCKIFHFAGHGRTDVLNPAKSSLLLSDGPLTIESLLETSLPRRTPFLAYLSACGTGQVRQDGLVDEGLHLMGAFQVAGFKNVIGTLWQVHDRSCMDIAAMTYQWIQKHGLSGGSVSEGLHHAIRRLRSQWLLDNDTRASRRGKQDRSGDLRNVVLYEDEPLYWVPYVHFGI
ncbi:TPR domain-containing protein [Thelonectria olida]|uniref:TPR domain-containing protein n=1 Tax=Thelonectria olida TaxID=1576542 RepID=A0A9P9ASC7_9HYPO|nr:TPR domain-containing protein [Thelonectria olida]